MGKRVVYTFLLQLLCLTVFAQPPIQKFWALNQCELIVPKLSVKPSAAYSLRRLFCNYTSYAINVRRSSDGTTSDIGFTSKGDLDTATLKSFVGSNSGYVTKWYDQTGNSNNLTQTTTANQPQIVNAGIVNRENGKPTIRFLSVYNEMYENNSINIQTFSAVRKAYKGALNDSMQYLVSVPIDQDFSIRSSSTTSWYYGDNNINDFSYNTGGAMYVNNAATYYYTNLGLHCVCANSGTASNNTFSLSSSFANGGGDRPRGMYGGDPVSELIVFPSTLTTIDRTRLYNDQKSYYGTN